MAERVLKIKTSTARQLILPEQLLLLYLGENPGITNNRQANFFLIAATMAELCLQHRLELGEEGTICVKDITPSGHKVADVTLKFIASQNISEARPRIGCLELTDELSLWIELIQRDLLTSGTGHSWRTDQFWKFVAHSLLKRGLLAETEKKGQIFRAKDYEVSEPTEKRNLLEAVLRAVSPAYKSDERMAHLISLVYKSDELSANGKLGSYGMKIIPLDDFLNWKKKYDVLSGEGIMIKKISEAAARLTEMAEQRCTLMPPLHG